MMDPNFTYFTLKYRWFNFRYVWCEMNFNDLFWFLNDIFQFSIIRTAKSRRIFLFARVSISRVTRPHPISRRDLKLQAFFLPLASLSCSPALEQMWSGGYNIGIGDVEDPSKGFFFFLYLPSGIFPHAHGFRFFRIEGKGKSIPEAFICLFERRTPPLKWWGSGFFLWWYPLGGSYLEGFGYEIRMCFSGRKYATEMTKVIDSCRGKIVTKWNVISRIHCLFW